METNPVCWFEIYVEDMDRAKNFYESVFQVKLEKMDFPEVDFWTFPMEEGRPGVPGALVHMEGAPVGGNSTLVYFSCADCAVEQARVADFGGSVEKGKLSIGEHGFIALVQDTEGNLIGLHSME